MTLPHRCPLPDPRVDLVGALDLEATPAGVRPRRLPAWTRRRMPDAFMDFVVQMASGVRLAFRTRASAVELELLATRTQITGIDDRPAPAVVDLAVDGAVLDGREITEGNLLRVRPDGGDPELLDGPPVTLRFDGLPAGDKRVELWLPTTAICDLVAVGADRPLEPAADTRPRWVHHGSSISHCLEADRPTGAWPVAAASLAGVHVLNLGLAGSAQLDPFTARVIRDLPADAVSLKLGVNVVNADSMRARAFAPAVHGFLDTVRDGHPDTPLLVVSPVPCPVAEDVPGPTLLDPRTRRTVALGDPARVAEGALTLRVVRDLLAGIVADRARDDGNLHYLDGRELLRPEEAAQDLPDGLHPDAAAYRRMGRRFADLAFGPSGPFHRLAAQTR